VGLGKYEKNSCTAFAEEIKIVHSGTKQRNLLQAGEIKFIQSLLVTKKIPAKKLPNPSPLLKNIMVHP